LAAGLCPDPLGGELTALPPDSLARLRGCPSGRGGEKWREMGKGTEGEGE